MWIWFFFNIRIVRIGLRNISFRKFVKNKIFKKYIQRTTWSSNGSEGHFGPFASKRLKRARDCGREEPRRIHSPFLTLLSLLISSPLRLFAAHFQVRNWTLRRLFPPQMRFGGRRWDTLSEAPQSEWSRTAPAAENDDAWPLRIGSTIPRVSNRLWWERRRRQW